MGKDVVLLIDGDATDIETAKSAFDSQEGQFRLEVADRLATGLARIAAGGIDIVLVHLHLPDADGFEALERTLKQAGGIPIIVLGKHDDAELALRVVQAGAQDYLVQGRMSGFSLARCARHALERHRRAEKLPRQGHGRRKSSKVVAFLGVKGGVGTTTTILNVAAALGLQGKRTIAVELGSPSSFAIQLNRPRAIDLSALLGVEAAEIDSGMLNEKVVTLPFGFHALFAPPRVADVREIQPDQAHSLVQSAGELAEFVLVDLPAQVAPIHRAVIPALDFVGLVLEPDPLSAQFAKSTVHLLEEWGVEAGSCGLVLVNRAALTSSLRPRDLRDSIGREVLGVVPPSGEACLLAFAAGKPLFAVQPDSRFSLAIKDLADGLTQDPVRTLSL